MKYNYKAISVDGKIVTGKIDKSEKINLSKSLENEGYFLFEVSEDKIQRKLLNPFEIRKRDRIRDKEISIVGNKLNVLLNSGTTLKESLIILKEGNDSENINNMLDYCLIGLDRGVLLSETLEMKKYPSLFVFLLKSGEQSGDMGSVFSQISEYYKKRYLLKEKMISSLIYPLILLVSTILVSIFTLVNVFPEIVGLYDYNNKELPIITRFLIGISGFISQYKYRLLVILLTISILVLYLYKLRTYEFQKIIYKSPIGSLYLKSFYALTFLETQKLILKSGLSLVKSIEIARMTISNKYVNEKLGDIQIEVEKGKVFSVLLYESDIFPKLISSMIRVGEESGEMLIILDDSIKYLEEELEELINRTTVLMEPIILIIITILIGGLVISIVTPMFEVTSFIY